MAGPHAASSPPKPVATHSSPQRTHLKKKKKPTGATSGDVGGSSTEFHQILHKASDPNTVLIEKRLVSSRATLRLDLSIASHRASERFPCPLVPLQVFPRAVLIHAHMSGYHLREIWLTNHHISILPPEISLFPQLRLLGLGGNALSSLPPEIAQLTSLEGLYLERNAIRVLPETVIFPRQLRDVRLDHNALTILPIQLTSLRLLQRLGLSHNRLTGLPVEIRRLRNLVEIDVDHNNITSCGLPDDALATLPHLERLGLDGNRLTTRPACLLRMPNVRYVRLNGNRGFSDLTGGQEDPGAVPLRHDGYYQCVQGYQETKDPTTTLAKAFLPLEGLVPSRDQNSINAMTYR